MRVPVSLAALLVCVSLLPGLAHAQQGNDEPRVIVVPVPGEGGSDAGMPPPPPPIEQPPPPPPPANNTVVQQPPPSGPVTTPDQAPPPPSEPLLNAPDNNAGPAPKPPPSAMLDGHPREGPFLAGPGSLTFVMHHTLMGGLGVLTTQMVPRIYNYNVQGSQFCGTKQDCLIGDDARLAYLAGALIGAGVGFASSAFWQFNNWIDTTSANFGIINSFIGAAFLAGFTNFFSKDASVVSWLGLIGAEAGAWISAIVGGGEIPMNKFLLIESGAVWALIYTALICAIFATTSSGSNVQSGIDALLIAPAIGAGALALSTLRFNPSTDQILRADLFGAAAGVAVLLIAGLVLNPATGFTKSPVPYVLSGIAAAGGITIVSLLWVDAADSGGQKNSLYYDPDRHKVSVWW